MDGIYPVFLENVKVGEAKIDTQGLYYAINCTCMLQQGPMHRLVICGDTEKIDLGVLIPEQGKSVLRTKIVRKKLLYKEPTFCILEPGAKKQHGWVVPNTTKTFAHLHQLEQLKLIKKTDGALAVQNVNEN